MASKTAFESAVDYIAKSPRSEKEVKDKLYKKGFKKTEIELAINKLKDYNYIGDEQYATTFVSYYAKKWGRKQLIYKLVRQKGIDSTLAKTVVDDCVSDEDEIEKCTKIAKSYIAKKKTYDKRAVSFYLYQRGFEFDIINKVLESVDTLDD